MDYFDIGRTLLIAVILWLLLAEPPPWWTGKRDYQWRRDLPVDLGYNLTLNILPPFIVAHFWPGAFNFDRLFASWSGFFWTLVYTHILFKLILPLLFIQKIWAPVFLTVLSHFAAKRYHRWN